MAAPTKAAHWTCPRVVMTMLSRYVSSKWSWYGAMLEPLTFVTEAVETTQTTMLCFILKLCVRQCLHKQTSSPRLYADHEVESVHAVGLYCHEKKEDVLGPRFTTWRSFPRETCLCCKPAERAQTSCARPVVFHDVLCR